MLFGAISVSKDRGSAFIIRLYASPLTPLGFILGYTLPLFIVAICQCVITFLASIIISAFTGYTFNAFRIFLAVLGFIPSVFLFIGLGILFGTVFSDKSAPPLCSIIISASSVLGGVFMDIGAMGGIWEKVCSLLPFYPAVTLGRKIINGEFEGLGYPILLTVVYAVVIFTLSVLIFKRKMKRDLK